MHICARFKFITTFMNICVGKLASTPHHCRFRVRFGSYISKLHLLLLSPNEANMTSLVPAQPYLSLP